MAWTDLSPYALAQVLHASDMNEIRLNLAETAPAIATAAGQVFYADGANSLVALDIANNSIYRAGASAPRWDSLLRTAVSDLTDNSQDDDVPTFGALRETFLPVAGLYTRFTSAGQAMSQGTPINVNLPSGKTFSDYRWILAQTGANSLDLGTTIWSPVSTIPEQGSDATLYMVDRNTNSLYSVDPSSGLATLIGSGLGTSNTAGLASHNGVLYMVDIGIPRALYSVDRISGLATLVGATGTGNPNGLASHNGVLYMVDINTDSLYSVDPSSGLATLIGDTGTDQPRGLASHNGVLYMVDSGTDSLYSVNTSSGLATLIGDTGQNSPTGLASHNGVLYMVDSGTRALYSVDPSSGLATIIGSGLGTSDPAGLASSSALLAIGESIALVRSSTTQLQVHPRIDGYLHEVVGVL